MASLAKYTIYLYNVEYDIPIINPEEKNEKDNQ